ncbi:MAG: polysaccharide deacetylase family protein [Candidatus Syntrophosphaera sp.]|nr:polysaccharide deacetylase family protein [Candidatus Syntrophosphaera sp.]
MDKFPNIIILLNLPREYIPKAEFVLRTFCSVLRLHPQFYYEKHFEGAHIYYGRATEKGYPIKIHFAEGTSGFFEQRELYPLDLVNFNKYKNEYIPFLFSQPGSIFSFNAQSITFRKDIVASGFYFLTCWHEYILGYHGEARGRVDYRQSLQYRWDFIDVPVIDVYCQMLLFAMGNSLPQFIREISWNKEYRFSISLSHDIDYWDYWAPGQKAETLRYNLRTFFKRPVNATYKILGHTLHKNLIHNPQRQARWILRKEEDLDVRSTWFLFGKDDFEDARQNYIADPRIRDRLVRILGDQEVGLHGSPESAYDGNALRKEMANLRSVGFEVTGYRSHYLNFDYQRSFRILEEAGIQYDSTLGYWENIGFRAGISFPFYPFNLEENRPFRVLEIPLIVMDTTLYSKKAMNLTPQAAKRTLKRLINMADKYQSHLSLLWHNVSFDPIDFTLWGSVYWSILRYARDRDAWISSLHDLYTEWVNLS